ncbi:CRE-SCL-18 protein [Caenorhabditis remanei]|uniref:CRE-SCL-18 protein n=1 Tax=Caenorhabditis remanei TaxID=31234 RepID=E3M821_CAERE|nr:CRE-SCL-18 protein [Caenorhabditis remanei]
MHCIKLYSSLITRRFFFLFIFTLQFISGTDSSFNQKGRQDVIDHHNKIRSQLALGNFVTKRHTKRASGSNIRRFLWNSTLEKSADSFAQTNPSKHSNINDIGENLFWHWSTKPGDFNKYGPMATRSWIQEFQDKYWDSNILTTALFGSGVGHATQMVWADTYQIGCSVANFKEIHKKTGRPITKICVVCHYWPKGNYLNEPIYLEGQPCSKCESKKCDKKTGLCI